MEKDKEALQNRGGQQGDKCLKITIKVIRIRENNIQYLYTNNILIKIGRCIQTKFLANSHTSFFTCVRCDIH